MLDRRDPVPKKKRKVKPSASSATSSDQDAPQPTDANPKHREDFNSLVGAAARKPAPKD